MGSSRDRRMDLRDTQDFFVYATLCVDGFPEEHQMTLAEAVDQLTESVEFALQSSRNRQRLHWLNLCQREMEQVRSAMAEGRHREIRKHLKAAREYFGSAVAREKVVIRFTAAPDGTIQEIRHDPERLT